MVTPPIYQISSDDGMYDFYASIHKESGLPVVVYNGAFSPVPEMQMVMILLSLIFLGLLIDATAVLIMFAAPLAAVCAAIGYDPVHSGVAIVIACLIGGVTPPVGTLLFIAAGIGEASRGDSPFVPALMIVNMIVVLIPQLVLFLPDLAF